MAGYGSDDGFNAYIAALGHTLPSGAPAPAVLRQRGSDYLDALYNAPVDPKAPRFSGYPTNPLVQERAYPRTGATAYGSPIASDIIPTAIINASYAAAWHEANNPGSLAVAATVAGTLKRKKIDTIEKEYFEGSGNAAADATVRISAVEGLVAPFLTRAEVGSIYVV
ncbi:MAG: DnaT-like ssDNA-binding protein [Pseudomonadota bacterium]|nr:DnaT-like ssDNA-binding protein [Pseudomonadota bacterium]MED5538641.1 DnaT-like ssDNA-binding protein [Pseudomonadota bacterium]